jgi:hypothetical protein
MQKLVILAALVAALLLTFPMSSGAAPTCTVNDKGQTTCVVNVTGRGSPTSCEASDEAFRTIQDAVAVFVPEPDPDPDSPRRVILVCPDTYATGDDGAGARVGIGRSAITIVSTNGPRVTKISLARAYGILINAHNVTIQGFTIEEGEKPSITPNTVGIFVRGDGIHVLNNIVADTDFGICVSELPPQEGLPASTVSNIVQDNLVYDNNHGIVVGLGCPAETGRSAFRSLISKNIVERNQTGITIAPGATAIFVEANRVRNNETGILDQGDLTKCYGNDIRNNREGNPPQGACASEHNRLSYIRR